MSVAVLWTGGKDSALALHEWQGRGVTELVTLVPPNAVFRAHDLGLMAWQARAVGLPHHQLLVEAPYEAGYRRALGVLQARGIERIVTGDIAEVAGQQSFISARAREVGLDVDLPLWGVDRRAHLRRLLTLGFDVLFTHVTEPWLEAHWVGRHLDEAALSELERLQSERGLDLAGENGEYHSMVLTGPGWASRLHVDGHVVSAPPHHRLQISSVARKISSQPT